MQYDEENNSHENQTIPKIYTGNWLYIVWFLFYFGLFWLVLSLLSSISSFGGEPLISLNREPLLILLILYAIFIFFAFSTLAEKLWRLVNGVRPLRLRREQERLYPLCFKVYSQVTYEYPKLRRYIQIYIKEDMSVNAFAFGKSTLVLTRGSIERLNDECLTGLIAHEFGHFAHGDTWVVLLMAIGNFFYSVLMMILKNIKHKIDKKAKRSIFIAILKVVYDIFFYVFRLIEFLSEVILMYNSRQKEYRADLFAYRIGFGEELNKVLLEIYDSSGSKRQSVKELIKATHPHITKRIEALETWLYDN